MFAPPARRAAGTVWTCALLFAGLVAPGASAIREETLWVNTAEDLVDGDTRSMDTLSLDPGPDGRVSLREAMLTAMNDNYPGQHVRIEIDAALVPLISVTSELPHITREGLELDGNGARLDGANCPECNGIIIEGGNNIVENFIIGSFPWYGVLLEGPRANENVVRKCQIGIWGDVPLPNYFGVLIENWASRNVISDNVISSNRQIGIFIIENANENEILRNLIGVTADGTKAIPNGYFMGLQSEVQSLGIGIHDAAGTIVGRAPDGGNLVSAFHTTAVYVHGVRSVATRIQSNRFVMHEEVLSIPTRFEMGGEINISSASNVLIGGYEADEGNKIETYGHSSAIRIGSARPRIPLTEHIKIINNRFSRAEQFFLDYAGSGISLDASSRFVIVEANAISGFQDGVEIRDGASHIRVSRNAIFHNLNSGISHRYYPDGPPLTVSISGSAPFVGTTAPCAKVEMFLDEGGQGREYIGAVYADGDGHFELLAPEDADPGLNVTAVALDPYGNTSAFSAPVPVALVARGALQDAPAPGPCERRYHPTVDQDQDGVISVDELLRVLQLYNSGGYSCAPGSEDGYAPGPGPQDCLPHSADFLIQDWNIDLDELLRTVQLYSSGGYFPCEGGEDGFCGAD